MNSILNLMKIRKGISDFSSQPVSNSILMKILEAGLSAPSGPSDSTHIIVVNHVELRRQLRLLCEESEKKWFDSLNPSIQKRMTTPRDYTFSLGFIENAPILLVVTTRPMDPEAPYAVESAFLAVGYMLVMLRGLGLESRPHTPSIMTDDDLVRLNGILKIPEGEKIQILLPIGYPIRDPQPMEFKGIYNVYLNFFGESFPECTS